MLTNTKTDIAFMADDAVPGPDGADWQAKDRKTFETSLAKFGEKLVSGIKAKSRPGPDYGNP